MNDEEQTPKEQSPEKLPYLLSEKEQRRKILLADINRIDSWTNTASENGLYDRIDKGDQIFDEIQNYLKLSRSHLDSGDLVDAERYSSKALRTYDKGLYSSTTTWRLQNVYALPIWIYLTGFLIAILVFYFVEADKGLKPPFETTAVYATTWGAVGGILRGIWYLKDRVSDRKYRNSSLIYYLSVPFLGALFGALVYLIFLAGTIIILPSQAGLLFNQTTSMNNTTETSTVNDTSSEAPNSTGAQSKIGLIFFSALGGFNWEWTVMIFKRIGDSFKSEVEPDTKLEK